METADFVGGGSRDMSDDERKRFEQQIAEAQASNAHWQTGRPIEERIAPRQVVVRNEGEQEETITFQPEPLEGSALLSNPTTVPDGFATGVNAEDEEE